MTDPDTLTADEPQVADARPEHPERPAPPELVIRPRKGWIGIDFKEIYAYRELLFFLVWRDIKVRYKQSVLGVAWAVLQPLLTMVIFTLIFGGALAIDSEGYPYAIFVYAGLLPWTFFSNGVTQAGQSLVNQRHMLTKIYFPRLFVPTSSIGAGLVDLSISFLLYVGIIASYCIFSDFVYEPNVGILMLPVLIMLTGLTAMGLGFLLAALTVSYRDFKYVVPFLVQTLMFVSPVIYPVSKIPEKFQWVLAGNPMFGIIDGYRSAILGKEWNWTALSISAVIAVVLFLFGAFYFRRTERRFADVV